MNSDFMTQLQHVMLVAHILLWYQIQGNLKQGNMYVSYVVSPYLGRLNSDLI